MRGAKRETDLVDDIREAEKLSVEERIEQALEMSEFLIEVARENGDPRGPSSLEEKARLWAAPLQMSKKCR